MSHETDQHTDRDYARWVKKLDDNPRRDLPDKDAQFIGGLLKTTEFTDKQRAWILDLVERYL